MTERDAEAEDAGRPARPPAKTREQIREDADRLTRLAQQQRERDRPPRGSGY